MWGSFNIWQAEATQMEAMRAQQYHYMMGLRDHYSRKGMDFIGIYEDRHTGKTVIRVQRKTTIPKVPR